MVSNSAFADSKSKSSLYCSVLPAAPAAVPPLAPAPFFKGVTKDQEKRVEKYLLIITLILKALIVLITTLATVLVVLVIALIALGSLK